MYFWPYRISMVAFPNCKINLGLHILNKREDGFHNIETVFYPVAVNDILEIIPSQKKESQIFLYGDDKNIPSTENICMKAYYLLKEKFKLPSIDIHLYKKIPHGAGLGGGSSNAAFTLKLLNNIFNLQLDNHQLKEYASMLGADCAFFIENKATIGIEKGNVFKGIHLSLKNYFITLVKPSFGISTQEAYAGVKTNGERVSLKNILSHPIHQWQKTLVNDFEKHLFEKHTELARIKAALINNGALYAAMSGSGSTLYGIFEKEKVWKDEFSECKVFQCMLN